MRSKLVMYMLLHTECSVPDVNRICNAFGKEKKNRKLIAQTVTRHGPWEAPGVFHSNNGINTCRLDHFQHPAKNCSHKEQGLKGSLVYSTYQRISKSKTDKAQQCTEVGDIQDDVTKQSQFNVFEHNEWRIIRSCTLQVTGA